MIFEKIKEYKSNTDRKQKQKQTENRKQKPR